MIKWGYATNQWKAGFTGFARMEQHERALKVTAACGFDAIELTGGTGRWDPMGRPENIALNFGSVEHFKLKLREWGIQRVASLFFDPLQMSFEELHHGLDCSDRSQHALLLQQAGIFARFLAEVGGEVLVVRALPPHGRHGGLDAERQAAAADCWNAVGAMTAALGIKTVLHLDALSPLRDPEELDAWLEQLDPATVGLAMDTAELTIAGHDVAAWYRRFQARVWHIHLKDALAVDTLDEYRAPNAERALLLAGGERRIPRWFGELGTGLVDWPALMAALREGGYDGWLIVESDKGPAPAAASMMQNAWTVRHVLQPLLA
ncbi:sugar phosphate isomerase/epimerase family protein [Ramlibacter sp. MAHUQ-53]|uniref:sugar phosphate isomerase/epimerase family protein n=1 Tax=unclassified Ramlibacter TaxID=2617605 RepID=UPI003627C975